MAGSEYQKGEVPPYVQKPPQPYATVPHPQFKKKETNFSFLVNINEIFLQLQVKSKIKLVFVATLYLSGVEKCICKNWKLVGVRWSRLTMVLGEDLCRTRGEWSAGGFRENTIQGCSFFVRFRRKYFEQAEKNPTASSSSSILAFCFIWGCLLLILKLLACSVQSTGSVNMTK